MTENQRKNRSAERPECSAQSVGDFCRKLITSMNMDLTLEVKEEPGLIFVNLTGPDRPFLLSNSASLLNSMEFLLNKAFRRVNDDSSSITLDSDSYRQHREMELVLLAQMASKKVLSLQKPLRLQPMTPRERRVVHLALTDIEGIHTQSDGEGDNRSITIYPS